VRPQLRRCACLVAGLARTDLPPLVLPDFPAASTHQVGEVSRGPRSLTQPSGPALAGYAACSKSIFAVQTPPASRVAALRQWLKLAAQPSWKAMCSQHPVSRASRARLKRLWAVNDSRCGSNGRCLASSAVRRQGRSASLSAALDNSTSHVPVPRKPAFPLTFAVRNIFSLTCDWLLPTIFGLRSGPAVPKGPCCSGGL
jgi:hypothetical protein